ncbi:MAG: hypothetical protein ACKORI_04265, partial [Verrucomicrobiota bacterium]
VSHRAEHLHLQGAILVQHDNLVGLGPARRAVFLRGGHRDGRTGGGSPADLEAAAHEVRPDGVSRGGARCRFIDSVGEVRRTAGAQTLRGEVARFDLAEDVLEMTGGVRFEDEGVSGSAASLRHEAGPGRTSLRRGDSAPVLIHLVRKGEEPAELSGDAVAFARRPGQVLTLLDVKGHAAYLTPTASLSAEAISASDTADGSGLLTASGSVSGEVEGRAIQGGRAVWNRALRRLDLSGPPTASMNRQRAPPFGSSSRRQTTRRHSMRSPSRVIVTPPSNVRAVPPGAGTASMPLALTDQRRAGGRSRSS